jgi:hypothetical protein
MKQLEVLEGDHGNIEGFQGDLEEACFKFQ